MRTYDVSLEIQSENCNNLLNKALINISASNGHIETFVRIGGVKNDNCQARRPTWKNVQVLFNKTTGYYRYILRLPILVTLNDDSVFFKYALCS